MFNTKVKVNTITDITLAQHKVWTIEGDRRGDVIDCLSGVLWVTQDGDLNDYVLDAGGKFWVTKRGTVVVQALQDGRFKYSLNEIKNHVEDNAQPIYRPFQRPVQRPVQPRVGNHLR